MTRQHRKASDLKSVPVGSGEPGSPSVISKKVPGRTAMGRKSKAAFTNRNGGDARTVTGERSFSRVAGNYSKNAPKDPMERGFGLSMMSMFRL